MGASCLGFALHPLPPAEGCCQGAFGMPARRRVAGRERPRNQRLGAHPLRVGTAGVPRPPEAGQTRSLGSKGYAAAAVVTAAVAVGVGKVGEGHCQFAVGADLDLLLRLAWGLLLRPPQEAELQVEHQGA